MHFGCHPDSTVSARSRFTFYLQLHLFSKFFPPLYPTPLRLTLQQFESPNLTRIFPPAHRKRKWAWGQGYPDPGQLEVEKPFGEFFPGFLCMAIRRVQLDHFLLHQHSYCRIQHWSSVTTMNWFIKPWGLWILPFLKVCMYSVRVCCVLWKCMITTMNTFSG